MVVTFSYRENYMYIFYVRNRNKYDRELFQNAKEKAASQLHKRNVYFKRGHLSDEVPLLLLSV